MIENNSFDESGLSNIDTDEKLEAYVQAHHKRFHNILFWANIIIIVNFAMVIKKIWSLYDGIGSSEILYLKVGLGLVIIAFAFFLYFQWKTESEIEPSESGRIKILLRYHIGIVNKEIGLIIGYLVAYTVVLIGGYIFFSVTGLLSKEKIAEIISPGTTFVYVVGVYFLYNSFNRRLKLSNGVAEIEKISGNNL